MIITRTPFRISFVGGGSDLEAFYCQSVGAVLSATIDKFMYISSHRFFDEDKIRVKYSRTETVTNVGDLQHPIVREVLGKFNIDGALEISSNADVRAGTGLGSSSSFTVGLLHNLYTGFGRLVTKNQLAEEACDIEINRLQEPIGKQDQYAAAFGGLNVIRFYPSGGVNVEPIHLEKEIYHRLQDNLLLFYLGEQRKAATILQEQKENMRSRQKVEILEEMVSLVEQLREALHEGDLEQFGRILHRNWLLKRQLASRISGRNIDALYEQGLRAGATGGKLLGAGGGGFLLFYCEKERQPALREAFCDLREMKFRFDGEGSKLIYVGDEYHES